MARHLRSSPGALYYWMREVWRRHFDVEAHTLQEEIPSEDLDLFENYWISQFAGLISDTEGAQTDSEVGRQVKDLLKSCEFGL